MRATTKRCSTYRESATNGLVGRQRSRGDALARRSDARRPSAPADVEAKKEASRILQMRLEVVKERLRAAKEEVLDADRDVLAAKHVMGKPLVKVLVDRILASRTTDEKMGSPYIG